MGLQPNDDRTQADPGFAVWIRSLIDRARNSTTSTRITIAILLAGILFLAILILLHDRFVQEFGGDFFKLTYQFVLIIVLGGVVSLVYREFSREQDNRYKERIREQEKRQEKKKLLLAFHDNLVEVYNDTKRIRRLTRARVRCKPKGEPKSQEVEDLRIDLARYDEYMQSLVNGQLKFEYFKRQVESNEKLFGSSPTLLTNLKSMEGYLGDIIDEYERSYGILSTGNSDESIARFPELNKFIDEDKNDEHFKYKFGKPFKAVLNAIDEAIKDDEMREDAQ